MWFDGASLDVKFIRHFELAENKLATVVGKHFTGWGVTGRLGNGVGGCLCGRRSWRGSVWIN